MRRGKLGCGLINYVQPETKDQVHRKSSLIGSRLAQTPKKEPQDSNLGRRLHTSEERQGGPPAPWPQPRGNICPRFLQAANAPARIAAAHGGPRPPSNSAALSKEAWAQRPHTRLSPVKAGVATSGPCHFSRGRRSQEVWEPSEPGFGARRANAGRRRVASLVERRRKELGGGTIRNSVTYFILEPPSARKGRTPRGAGGDPTSSRAGSLQARPGPPPPAALHSPSSPACSRSGAETTSRRARRPRAPATMAPPGASLARSASPRRAQRLRCPGRAASSAAERAAGTGRSRGPALNPIGAAGSPARRGRRPPRPAQPSPAPRAGPQRRKSSSLAAAGREAGGAPDSARGLQ